MRSKGLILFAAFVLFVSCLVATMRITHKFSESFENAVPATKIPMQAPLAVASSIGTPQDQIIKLKARVEMDSQTMDKLRKQIPNAQSNFGDVCSNILRNSPNPQLGAPIGGPGMVYDGGGGMIYDGGGAVSPMTKGAVMMPQGAAQGASMMPQGASMMPQGASQGAIRG